MSYFSKFPITTYQVGTKIINVQDILRRCTFISEYKPYSDLFNTYTIKDGDTPQSIAKILYSSAAYHWVVLMFNEIHSMDLDWPMDIDTLEKYCKDKYGTAYDKRKWTVKDGLVVGEIKEFSPDVTWVEPAYVSGGVAVSFLDYEGELNDAKREINLMRVELLSEFVRQFEAAINE